MSKIIFFVLACSLLTACQTTTITKYDAENVKTSTTSAKNKNIIAQAEFAHESPKSEVSHHNGDIKEKKAHETHWMAIFLAGKKMGHQKFERIVRGDQVTSIATTHTEMNRLGTTITNKSVVETTETIDGKPLRFTFSEEGVQYVNIKGVVSPEGIIDLQIESAGQVIHKKEAWPLGALLPQGAWLLALKNGSKAGTEYEYISYMPDAMQAINVKVTVGETKEVDLLGKRVNLTEISQTVMFNGAPSKQTIFVDQNLAVQKFIMLMNGAKLESISTSEHFALSPNNTPDMATLFSVASPSKIWPTHKQSPLKYSIMVNSADVHFPNTAEQNVTVLGNGKISLEVTPLMIDEGSFPYQGKEPDLLKYLAPNRWIQSDHPLIVTMAKRAIGNSVTAGQAAKNIESFVRNYISDKNYGVGYASALETVKSKQGDCTEHALLVAALLKAVGIPARIASGAVHDDRLQRFIVHAWTQAYIGGQWVSYDAAQNGFGSGHILFSLYDGDPQDAAGKNNTLGNFDIATVSVMRDSNHWFLLPHWYIAK